MTLFEAITVLNLVILLYVVYSLSKMDVFLEELIEGFNTLWDSHQKDKANK